MRRFRYFMSWTKPPRSRSVLMRMPASVLLKLRLMTVMLERRLACSCRCSRRDRSTIASAVGDEHVGGVAAR